MQRDLNKPSNKSKMQKSAKLGFMNRSKLIQNFEVNLAVLVTSQTKTVRLQNSNQSSL